jgi:hypothetical protein
MLKIGIDKTDRSFRKFEYDDERMYGNPQVFKVLYEETGSFGEVMCSNVISIKKSNNTHNHFLDIPIHNENVINFKSKPETDVESKEEKTQPSEEKKNTRVLKSKLKSKTKTEQLKPSNETIKEKEPDIKLDIKSILPNAYEYDVLTIDNISYVEDIKYKLNELGKDGWEVCGFQAVNKLFGCQIIIIMKKGVN